MSKILLQVETGVVDFYPEGMFEGEMELTEEDGEVNFEVNMVHPVQPLGDMTIQQTLEAFVRELGRRFEEDKKAPAVGSASKLFRMRPGTFKVECLEGMAVIRVYHVEVDSPYKGEGSSRVYLDEFGDETDDAYHHIMLNEGEAKTFDTIESNAITIAFYT